MKTIGYYNDEKNRNSFKPKKLETTYTIIKENVIAKNKGPNISR